MRSFAIKLTSSRAILCKSNLTFLKIKSLLKILLARWWAEVPSSVKLIVRSSRVI